MNIPKGTQFKADGLVILPVGVAPTAEQLKDINKMSKACREYKGEKLGYAKLVYRLLKK